MKAVVSQLFKVLIPILYFVFIFAGFVCALISGVIEYLVIKELFNATAIKALASFSIPLLVVFAFEATKLFLVFYQENINKTQKRIFNLTRNALILFSVICTLLFSFDQLNNPRGEEEKARQIQIEEQNLAEQIVVYRKDLEYYQTIMNEERGTGIRDRYRDAQDNYNHAKVAISQLNQSHLQRINAIQTSTASTQQTDNKLLSSALLIYVRAFHNTNEYTPRAYITLVIILSLLLSLGLEIVIYASLKVLAQTNPKSMQFSNHTSGNPTELIILSVIPGLVIFLGYIAFIPTFSNLLAVMIVTFLMATTGIFIVHTIKSHDLIVKKVENFVARKVIFEAFFVAVIGAIITIFITVILLSLYGMGSKTVSLYGFILALTCGLIGKISSDAIIEKKVMETDRFIEEIDIQKEAIRTHQETINNQKEDSTLVA